MHTLLADTTGNSGTGGGMGVWRAEHAEEMQEAIGGGGGQRSHFLTSSLMSEGVEAGRREEGRDGIPSLGSTPICGGAGAQEGLRT